MTHYLHLFTVQITMGIHEIPEYGIESSFGICYIFWVVVYRVTRVSGSGCFLRRVFSDSF